MKGADYMAVRRITNREGKVLAAVGATCENVPANALSWLLEGGDIAPATKPARAAKAAPVSEKE